MCQVDGEADELIPPKPILKDQKICVKCDQKASHVVGTNGTFCSACFEKYFSHKFRAAMGRNPVVRNGDKVLLAYSGGNNSSALLHLIQRGLSPAAPKKLKFSPGILFVDERVLYPDQTMDEVEEVQRIMKESGFPHHTVKLQEIFEVTDESNELGNENESASKLLQLFQSAKTLTAKQELLYRTRCLLISKTGRKLNYQHVFLGETSTRLAINILSNVALGRGVHLPQDTGFSDGNRYSDIGVDLLRPLRDISAKEIVMYNGIHKVPTVFFPNLSTKQTKMSSIANLTEEFVLGLVAGFPSTEMTVYRTSNKIKTIESSNKTSQSADDADSDGICRLCYGRVDCRLQQSGATASKDTAYSTELCRGAYGHSGTPDVNRDVIMKNNSSEVIRKDKNKLCYACTRLEKEMLLPSNIDLITALPQLSVNKSITCSQSDVEKLKDLLITD